MHDLHDSALVNHLSITAEVPAADPRTALMGKRVRFVRPSLLLGSAVRQHDYEVREIQNNYRGDPCVRVYCLGYDDTFGRCANVRDLEVIR